MPDPVRPVDPAPDTSELLGPLLRTLAEMP